jgi:chromosome segregation ATPase
MPDKTIVEQLAAANSAVADMTAKLTAAQTESAAKIGALEASVKALTDERETMKAEAVKAAEAIKAASDQAAVSAKTIEDLTAKNKALEARLADPSFKAAATTGEAQPVPTGGNAEAGVAMEALKAAYEAENDPVKKAVLGAKLVKQLEGK